jgi:hypothetical protein
LPEQWIGKERPDIVVVRPGDAVVDPATRRAPRVERLAPAGMAR